MASERLGSVIQSLQCLFGTGTVTALSEAQLLERFVSVRDEAAFEAILTRHGPMVLGVCRRILDDPHDVDDAFQATFLILVKKAGSIRDRDVLGTWLYGVARRVAVRARVNARRRRICERTTGTKTEASANGIGARRLEAEELRSLIDHELERLPQKYRTPLVLCDLEGQSHEQAAAQLRCPVGTVKSRLARGRERLRWRLVRCGVAPTAGLAAPLLAADPASAVPAALIHATIRGASRLAAGQGLTFTAGALSSGVAALCQGAMGAMKLSKLKCAAAAAILLVATGTLVLTGTRAIVGQNPPSNNPPNRMPPPAPPPAPAERAVERFQLDNGLKVILRPIQGARNTALIVLYSLGNDHDPAGQSGVGHLLEHVYLTAAAGSTKARTIEELMRRYPDGANGQTGDRYTVFATTFPATDLDAELKDAAARMNDLRLSTEGLGREKERLFNEVENMFASFPPLAAQNNARELVRPTPRGGRRGGIPDQVRSLTLQDVEAQWKRYYKPRNAILGLAGAVDRAAARAAITAHFAQIPAGAPAPEPGEPGKPDFGAVRKLTVPTFDPQAQRMACLAYAAPRPGSELYAPMLVLVARLWASGEKLGGGSPGAFPVYFTPLDDGAVVAVSTPLKSGETDEKALARLETFVAETIAPKLRNDEPALTQQQLGFLLGTADVPDTFLQNIYGVAFSLARRDQLGIDTRRLGLAIQAVTEQELRRAAKEVFTPARHVAAVVSPTR
jgi:zinc protease